MLSVPFVGQVSPPETRSPNTHMQISLRSVFIKHILSNLIFKINCKPITGSLWSVLFAVQFFGNLQKHQKTVHEGKYFTCDVCQAVIKDSSNFRRHVKTHESSHLKCPECSKLFSRKDKLNEHHETCRSNMLLKMIRENNYQNYKLNQIVKTSNDFPCEKCEKQFTTKYSLQRHMKTHSVDKPKATKSTKCSHCNKDFVNSSSLCIALISLFLSLCFKMPGPPCSDNFALKY